MTKIMVAVVVLAMLVMSQFMVQPIEAISCGDVATNLAPCTTYLTQGGTPTPSCCDGVKKLKDSLPTQADRQTACQCTKSAAAQFPNLKPDAASRLPQACGVTINVHISPNTDCKNIP